MPFNLFLLAEHCVYRVIFWSMWYKVDMFNFTNFGHLLNDKPKLWLIWKTSICLSRPRTGRNHHCHRPTLERTSSKGKKQNLALCETGWTGNMDTLVLITDPAPKCPVTVQPRFPHQKLRDWPKMACMISSHRVLKFWGLSSPLSVAVVLPRPGECTGLAILMSPDRPSPWHTTLKAHHRRLDRHVPRSELSGTRALPWRQCCFHPIFQSRGKVHFFGKCRLQMS